MLSGSLHRNAVEFYFIEMASVQCIDDEESGTIPTLFISLWGKASVLREYRSESIALIIMNRGDVQLILGGEERRSCSLSNDQRTPSAHN